MIKEENERAMRESKFVTNTTSPSSQSSSSGKPRNSAGNDENEPGPRTPSGLDRTHLVNAYGNVAKGLPERRVKGLPPRVGAGAGGGATDAQVEAARARVSRWRAVNAAVGGMTYTDAACGTDNLLANEPATARQLYERGAGPYASCRTATTQTGGDDRRDFDTQTDAADRRSVFAQCPEDLVLSREQMEVAATSAAASESAAAARKKMAATLAVKWARATGDLQHSKDRRLAAFITRVGAVAETLLTEKDLAAGRTTDLMRNGGQLKEHAVPGQPGSLTASYMKLHDPCLTAGRVVTHATFAPGTRRGASLLLVSYTPVDARARGVAGCGLLLVWDLGALTATPAHAMVLEGTPTCVVWGPGESQHLVLCGTEDGAVCVWDLREPEEMHRTARRFGAGAGSSGGSGNDGPARGGAGGAAEAEEERTPEIMNGRPFRRPSYCTEAFSEEFPEDAGALVSLGVAVDTASGSREGGRDRTGDGVGDSVGDGDDRRAGDGEGAGGGTARSGDGSHLITLDCWGNVSTYLMSELSRREAMDVALTDMGLRFGSRVRLLKAASSIRYGGGGGGGGGGTSGGGKTEGRNGGGGSGGCGGGGMGRTTAQARDMSVRNCRGTATEFFVAAETGQVLRGARCSSNPKP